MGYQPGQPVKINRKALRDWTTGAAKRGRGRGGCKAAVARKESDVREIKANVELKIEHVLDEAGEYVPMNPGQTAKYKEIKKRLEWFTRSYADHIVDAARKGAESGDGADAYAGISKVHTLLADEFNRATGRRR